MGSAARKKDESPPSYIIRWMLLEGIVGAEAEKEEYMYTLIHTQEHPHIHYIYSHAHCHKFLPQIYSHIYNPTQTSLLIH